jgi:hypothetical protein
VDRVWVHWLGKELQKAGFSVFVDEWCIRPGMSWRLQIEAALLNSEAGIVVLSPEAVASGAVDAEITAMLIKSWAQSQPFVPVLYRDCEIPALLSSRQFIDFRSQDPAIQSERLGSIVKALRGQPPGALNLPKIKVRRRISLRVIPVTVISLLLSLLLTWAGINVLNVRPHIDALKRMQANIQGMDEQLRHVVPSSCTPETAHYDLSGARAAVDVRAAVDGVERLKWRNFYKNNKLIARDEFIYEGAIQRKIRYYLDDDQRAVLIDYFDGDKGTLTKKLFCPNGSEPCETRIVEMLSPFPPLFFCYR